MNHASSERDRFVLVLFYGVLLLAGYLAFRIVAPFATGSERLNRTAKRRGWSPDIRLTS